MCYYVRLMIKRALSSKLQKMIDPIKFARAGCSINGAILISDMPRLASECDGDVSKIKCSLILQGGKDNVFGVYYLRGEAETLIPLMCQRCLNPIDYILRCTISLSPVIDERRAALLPSDYAHLFVTAKQISLANLLEDELLLALPLVAKHEKCDNMQAVLESDADTCRKPDRKSPFFEVLKGLR